MYKASIITHYIAHRRKKTPLTRSMCRVLMKKTRLQCTTKTVNLHVRLTQMFWNKFHVVGPATAKVRRPYTHRAETVEQRVDMGAGSKCGLVWQDPPLPPLRSRPP